MRVLAHSCPQVCPLVHCGVMQHERVFIVMQVGVGSDFFFVCVKIDKSQINALICGVNEGGGEATFVSGVKRALSFMLHQSSRPGFLT